MSSNLKNHINDTIDRAIEERTGRGDDDGQMSERKERIINGLTANTGEYRGLDAATLAQTPQAVLEELLDQDPHANSEAGGLAEFDTGVFD